MPHAGTRSRTRCRCSCSRACCSRRSTRRRSTSCRDHSLFLVVWARYAGQMLVVTPFARHRAGPALLAHAPPAHAARCARCCSSPRPASSSAACATCRSPKRRPSASSRRCSSSSRDADARRAADARALDRGRSSGSSASLVLLRPGSPCSIRRSLLLLGAALTNALYQVLTRKVAGDSSYTTLFYSALVGAVVLTLALPWGFDQSTIAGSAAGSPARCRAARRHRRTGSSPRASSLAPRVAAHAVHLRADGVGDAVRATRVRPAAGPAGRRSAWRSSSRAACCSRSLERRRARLGAVFPERRARVLRSQQNPL